MSTATCNCSILGGTTDSRPCPVHDDPAGKPCRVCNCTGTIQYEDGAVPCPYCDPAGARKAATS